MEITKCETEILYLNNRNKQDCLQKAGAVLGQGGVIAFPTETVYALACRLNDENARKQLANSKQQPLTKPLQILLSSFTQVDELCQKPEWMAKKLMRCFWPGPLTLVLAGRSGEFVGLRLPDHHLSQRLLQLHGNPVYATSANMHGQKPLATAQEVIACFSGKVNLVIVSERRVGTQVSTVVKVCEDKCEVLRVGAISRQTIMQNFTLKKFIIGVGTDHAGVVLKDRIIVHLREQGLKVINFGRDDDSPADYPDIAFKIGSEVSSGKITHGILVCGTGIGMSIAANKVRGVRASLCTTRNAAVLARNHNDANILVLAGRDGEAEDPLIVVDTWLDTAFSLEERHQRRLQKISDFENNQG